MRACCARANGKVSPLPEELLAHGARCASCAQRTGVTDSRSWKVEPGQASPLMSPPDTPSTRKLSMIALSDAHATFSLLQKPTLTSMMSLFDVHIASRLCSMQRQND